MQSNKAESGSSNIECLAFPKFSKNKEALKDKTCHIIEPYDDGKLISIFIKRVGDGSVIKVLDKDAVHLELKDVPELDKHIKQIINMCLHLKLPQVQLFLSIKGEEIIIVDVFANGFVSPGMLNDIFGKRIGTQIERSTERYDPDKVYNAIIKPKIPCYEDKIPIYIKG